MIELQRLIIIMISINAIIGFSSSAYENINTYNDDTIVAQALYGQTQTDSFLDDNTLYTGLNKDQITEPSIGNSLSWGKIIIDGFKYSIPFVVPKNVLESDLEKNIIDALSWIRFLMLFVTLIAIYSFIINRN